MVIVTSLLRLLFHYVVSGEQSLYAHTYSTAVAEELENMPTPTCGACATLSLRKEGTRCRTCQLMEAGDLPERKARVRQPHPNMCTAYWLANNIEHVGSTDDLVVSLDDDQYKYESDTHRRAAQCGSFSFVRDEEDYIVPVHQIETSPVVHARYGNYETLVVDGNGDLLMEESVHAYKVIGPNRRKQLWETIEQIKEK